MIFIKFVRFILGYIRVTISGDYPERFLNLCAANGVTVWNVSRNGDVLSCSMFARDYRHARRFRRKSGTRLKIKRKKGAPFIYNRYKHRKGLMVGLAIFIAFLMIMPKYVWSVEISGNEKTDAETIIKAAEKIGIKSGAKISDIDPDNLRPTLLVELPELSWAAINIEGSRITLDVRERLKPETVLDNTPCNLVATRDGIITSVYIKRGSAAVKVGDAVRKGDLLAMGTVEYGDQTTVIRHSMGEVYAETTREITVKSPFTVTQSTPTGKEKTKRVFEIFGLKIPLYLGSERYDYTSSANKTTLMSGDMELPLSIITARFYEVKKANVKLTAETAKENAKTELKALEKSQLDGIKIKDKKLSFAEKDGYIILTASYICEENIAIESPLIIVD